MSITDSWCPTHSRIFLTLAVMSFIKSQPKCFPWWHKKLSLCILVCPSNCVCKIEVKAQLFMWKGFIKPNTWFFFILLYQTITVGYIHGVFRGCTWNGIYCVHSLPTFSPCVTVFMLIQCDHSRPRLQLSHLPARDVWDRGSLSTNGEKTLWRILKWFCKYDWWSSWVFSFCSFSGKEEQMACILFGHLLFQQGLFW